VNRALAGYNTVLSDPPKSPSQIPMFNVAPNTHIADFNEAMNWFRDELSRSLESSLVVQIKPNRNTYHKSYPSAFDFMKAPDGWRVPKFYKFSGDDSKSTREHFSMFLAQMGEGSNLDFMDVWNFVWFTSLPSCLISSWVEFEEKFHDHFYNGVYKTRLSRLTSVYQGCDESILDFVKCFKEIKN
jgi:hypothetical protein